jgi:hypothetical protein
MTPDNPTGTGDEAFASIDAAMDALPDEEEQDQQPQGADNQAQPGQQDDPNAETPEAGADDGEDDIAEITDPDGEDAPGPDDYTGGQFAAHTAKVKLADGRVTTVAELVGGSMMLGDYRTKTAEVARERQAVQAKAKDLESLATELNQARETVAVLARLLQPEEPDETLLAQGDFATYELQKRAKDTRLAAINYLMAEHQKHVDRQKADSETKTKEKRQQEAQALRSRIPAFFDQQGRPTKAYGDFWQAAVKAGEFYGYSADELNAMVDHRQYLVLRDALAYRRIKAAEKKPTNQQQGATKRPVMRGGRPSGNPQQQALDAARARFNKEPSLRNAVDLID